MLKQLPSVAMKREVKFETLRSLLGDPTQSSAQRVAKDIYNFLSSPLRSAQVPRMECSDSVKTAKGAPREPTSVAYLQNPLLTSEPAVNALLVCSGFQRRVL